MRFLVLGFFILFVQNLFCQDTIRFKNGDVKAVKVNEVGLYQVSYSRLDLSDGPTYTVNKSDIFSIKYKNGQIDTFDGVASPSNPIPNTTQPSSPAFTPKEPIVILGNRLYYQDKNLKDKTLLRLVTAYPEGARKIALQESYHQMDDYKAKQYLVGFLGAGAAFNMVLTGLIVGGKLGPNTGFLFGMATYLTTNTISKNFKRKRLMKRMETARLYNGG